VRDICSPDLETSLGLTRILEEKEICNSAQEACTYASDPNALHRMIKLASALGPHSKHRLDIREGLRRSAICGCCCSRMQELIPKCIIGAVEGWEKRGKEFEG
jgi:hypothetical protein